MSSAKLVRIDYVKPGSYCLLCKHDLKMAHVILSAQGKEFLCGCECVHKLGIDNLKEQAATVPNLTARAPAVKVKQQGAKPSTNKAEATEKSMTAEDEIRLASEYLWLRLDKVHALCPERASLLWKPLVDKFEILKEKKILSISDARMVISTENHAPLELKRLNLLYVYAAAHQLRCKIDKSKSELDIGCLEYLKSHLALTKKQIHKTGLNLPPGAFNWYITT